MNTQAEVLKYYLEKLEHFGIPYMITGSLASSLYAEPRASIDFDFIIDPNENNLHAFIDSFDERFYADWPMAFDALRSRGMFNIIDTHLGFKADFILRENTDYGKSSFDRRIPSSVSGISAVVTSMEDSILSKLVLAQKSNSERQRIDVYGIVHQNFPNFDMEYLDKWATVLNVSDLLQEIIDAVRQGKG